MHNNKPPLVLSGPLLRRLTPDRLTIWLATQCDCECRLELSLPDGDRLVLDAATVGPHQHQLQAGEHCYFVLLDLPMPSPLPVDVWIGYDLLLRGSAAKGGDGWLSCTEWAPDLTYVNRQTPGFVIKKQLDKILHGSCRKPHHPSQDGLIRADQLLAAIMGSANANPAQSLVLADWPALLMLSGDQVYADDVAGPILVAIHRLLEQLGMPEETIAGVDLPFFADLHQQAAAYYQRQTLLPQSVAEGTLADVLFTGIKKPVFTSDNARNHLVSLAEVLAMYLLVWSPSCWQLTSLEMPANIPLEFQQKYQQESEILQQFVASLTAVRRVLAHLPVAMIFDDHDVTDDWNLTLGWEQTAYQHPYSKRIIGNALMGYFICQGWGNAAEKFSTDWLQQAQGALNDPAAKAYDKFIDRLLDFSEWHYEWPTHPLLVVLDTRTHRWRSERSANLPSGLMDWEAISELQQTLLDQRSVVMVSPAPVFGVKLIETIQRVFSWFGKPLMVDAEYWMAHSGAAYAILNLFRHTRTPQHFVILSGDVHYSFFYRVQLRGRDRGPDIWQITSSGLSNEFPESLIEVFDRLDRWLYSPRSPLNWFTKRRNMKVTPHKPANASPGERLVNAAGIGLVELSTEGTPVRVAQLCSNGEDVEFVMDKANARWE